MTAAAPSPAASTHPERTEPEGRGRGERGVVLILFAILLLVLLAFAGFAVELGHWYYEANRQQKAADSAALAGAVLLPGDSAGAIARATALAKTNGYDGANCATGGVCVTVTPVNTNQLQVTIQQSVKNFFISALGQKTQSISRSAVAEYEGPVDMGSPANTFGNEPTASNDATQHTNVLPGTFPGAGNQPLFWGNIAGPQTPKENGDAYAAGWCSQANPDHCDANDTNPLHNQDFKPTGVGAGNGQAGYFYKVHAPAMASGKRFQIQVYDPAFIDVGDHCTNNLSGATGATNPFVTDAAARYAAGDGAFCSGDALFGDNNPSTTTYIVRDEDNTPNDDTNNPMETDNSGPEVCTPLQFKGYSGDLSHALKQGDPAYVANPMVATTFRQWVPICTVQNSDGLAHDYYLQVLTDIRFIADPVTGVIPNPTTNVNFVTDPTAPGGGHNRFAVRAFQVLSSGNGTGGCTPTSSTPVGNTNWPRVGTPLQYSTPQCEPYDTTAGTAANQKLFSLSGDGKMSLYVNTPSSTTQFYLARVLPTSSGQTLNLNFYDINDCSSCNPKLTVLQPAGSSGAAWGGALKCTVTAPTTPSATSQSPLSGCLLASDPTFNAHWVTVSVPIPTDYNCVTATPTACWVQVKIDYGAGASIADTTTWSANISGDPVRLIQ